MTKLEIEGEEKERGESRGGGGHEYNIVYLGPEAVDAHSERGWFWLVCAFPGGAL